MVSATDESSYFFSWGIVETCLKWKIIFWYVSANAD